MAAELDLAKGAFANSLACGVRDFGVPRKYCPMLLAVFFFSGSGALTGLGYCAAAARRFYVAEDIFFAGPSRVDESS